MKKILAFLPKQRNAAALQCRELGKKIRHIFMALLVIGRNPSKLYRVITHMLYIMHIYATRRHIVALFFERPAWQNNQDWQISHKSHSSLKRGILLRKIN